MLRNLRKFSLRHEINLFVGNCQYLIKCSTVKVLSFQNMTWAFYLLIFRFKVIWRPSQLTKMVTFSLLWLKLWSLQALGTFVFFLFFLFYLFICLLACAVLNFDIDIKKNSSRTRYLWWTQVNTDHIV